ncbi:Rne/Rng family ribonuclease [Nitratireductor luteus]|uniref:Rne/Rng family ribonuclease n=1 Tax=Nitratireductor luteus TaxID=2976980 RepID=UPI00223FABAF|nr:ribonuclease E/G [Nitratireductor luteus]
MPNKMLIDASHPEETRVVVVRGSRIEEFDFESQDKKQLRGNIYLARVTRVEPSLQAAFVEYGGNRHGFLAFSEIHPDYYQIPVADRQALLKAEAEEAKAADDEADEKETQSSGRGKKRRRASRSDKKAQTEAAAEGSADGAQALEAHADVVAEDVDASGNSGSDNNGEDEVDTVGAEDALDEAQNRRRSSRRNYKIQEVIKRRQILLVQVVKEERGNKGAALTTYLSLAGRYSVLMPNTARGGGISRKITSLQDRKRLKDVVKDLSVPDGMGVILRTAGANRTKAEVKRDYEYLMRMWERVRSLTLESTAPALVYEEGSLIKRSVRDLYNKDIDEILVAGDEGYREAKDFMRMLMPSHAKAVQPYRDSVPIFARNGIEGQLDKMLQPQVTLKSGGYIIINQTEALVAIDVNSGRSTKEHSIEDTALQTNLEAAEEVARQLRLRDLAGLIVIDFIDMEENRNNRSVEKRLKDCLKNDRARIQVGRISHFGLLEMSRQRIRASVLESTMQPCPHCGGTGHVRSESSVALLVVRSIEEYLLKDARNDIRVRTPSSTALYLLNHKRANLVDLENRFGVTITVETDDELGGQHYAIVKGPPSTRDVTIEIPAIGPEMLEPEVEDEPEPVEEEAVANGQDSQESAGEDGQGQGRKRRRKRRRRGGRDRNNQEGAAADGSGADRQSQEDGDEEQQREAASTDEPADEDGAGSERKKRHRGKRGGRRNRRDEQAEQETVSAEARPSGDVVAEPVEEGASPPASSEEAPAIEHAAAEPAEAATALADDELRVEDKPAEAPEKPVRKPRKRTSRAKAAPAEATPEAKPTEAESGDAEPAPAEKKKRTAPRRKVAAAENAAKKENQKMEPVLSSTGEPEEKAPRKSGWWQRKSFF